MRTAQPLMERLNDWQSHNTAATHSNTATRGQQVDNTAPLQLASHYTRTLIIRSIYRPFCTFNARTSSQTPSSPMDASEIEAYTHYRLAAKSAAHRFTDFAREISDRQIRAFWPFCKQCPTITIFSLSQRDFPPIVYPSIPAVTLSSLL
jgi:hypothetical protein